MRIDDFFVNFYCPNCNYPVGVFMGQVRRDETVTCTKCGEEIQLRATGDDLGEIQRTLDNMEDQLKHWGGEIVIRL
ncbi:MAG: hypothetical protein ACE5LG_07565 [Anaerolineae bacterium]